MGQQQLLLLVLGIVIVGLAVVVGIEAFGENQRKFRQDQTVHLMMDVASKAQLWKLTPPPLGGGGDGSDPRDFSAFRLEAIGLTPTSQQGSSEILLRTEYACFKMFPRSSGLQINALDTGCKNGSWWMRMDVTGTGEGDIGLRISNNLRRRQRQRPVAPRLAPGAYGCVGGTRSV